MYRCIIIFIAILLAASCRPTVLPPKPSGYFRIDTPATHSYQVFDRPGYPYTFEYPVYGVIQDDTTFRKKNSADPYWINIYFPSLNGVINITYKSFKTPDEYVGLVNDAFNLSFFHNKETNGSGINSFDVHTPYTSGVLYVAGGNVASKYQFTLTDSVHNFIRGALYFDVTPNADSLKPVTDFIEKDIEHLFRTLKWK